MTRPRRPFGPNLPGRLPATMLKVLAAEMSDAGRLTRGKRYWHDDAVVDLDIGPDEVTASVLGSRPEPYLVTVQTRPGHGPPSRRDVHVTCTCPDDDGSGQWACKHAVAALFSLADEVSIDPGVLATWRRSDDLDVDVPSDDDAPVVEMRMPTEPLPGERPTTPVVRASDEINELLLPPPGQSLAAVPPVGPVEHPRLGDPLLDDVLADALAQLRLRW